VVVPTGRQPSSMRYDPFQLARAAKNEESAGNRSTANQKRISRPSSSS
jgi:hypothetical protein